MFLVVGGQDVNTLPLDSTELYDPRVGIWKTIEAKLPLPTMGLRAVNIDDRILVFGNTLY